MSLGNFLRTSRNARRVFGRRELEIIFRQLAGMPLTQSEKNRLSRDIRPKFEFIREASTFSEEFGLSRNQDNRILIQGAVNAVLKDRLGSDVMAVLLFGSFADMSFSKRSDIDIAVVFGKSISLREATKFRIRVSGNLPNRFDVQVFDILPQKVKREIARSHKVLFKKVNFDNVTFSINYLKDEDYFIRMRNIFGVVA